MRAVRSIGARQMPSTWLTTCDWMILIWPSLSFSLLAPSQTMFTSSSVAARIAPAWTDFQKSCVVPLGMTAIVSFLAGDFSPGVPAPVVGAVPPQPVIPPHVMRSARQPRNREQSDARSERITTCQKRDKRDGCGERAIESLERSDWSAETGPEKPIAKFRSYRTASAEQSKRRACDFDCSPTRQRGEVHSDSGKQ